MVFQNCRLMLIVIDFLFHFFFLPNVLWSSQKCYNPHTLDYKVVHSAADVLDTAVIQKQNKTRIISQDPLPELDYASHVQIIPLNPALDISCQWLVLTVIESPIAPTALTSLGRSA